MAILGKTFQTSDQSRRVFLAGAAAAVTFAASSCRTPDMRRPTDATDRALVRLGQHSEAIARAEPNLPGFRTLERAEGLIGGFGRDASFLNGALYLRARERIVAAGERFTQSEIRTALARPADPERFGRPFLEQTLVEARARAARDTSYAQAIRVGGQREWRCVDEFGSEVFTFNICLSLIRRGILIAVFVVF